MSPATPGSPWQRLLHRWFVEYNPLYLLSAMLVLGGMILSSRGLAHDGSLYGQIGIAAIAELYSVVLIGGAALLMRVGHRRSAVMLALLTALYQCDLTLHTETCPNLAFIGVLASGAWLVLFVAKLFALAWAMKLRLSHSTIATATLGALGLAVFPYCFQRMEDPRAVGALVMLWLFAVFTIRSLAERSDVDVAVDHYGVGSIVGDLDLWGHTVLKRAVRATWILWALLLSLHVLFWSTQYRQLELRAILPIAPLLFAWWIRGEARMWAILALTLLLVGLNLPGSFSVSALVAAGALCLRAWTAARSSTNDVVTTTTSRQPRAVAFPYRAPPSSSTTTTVSYVAATQLVAVDGRAAMRRFLLGAVLAIYLSVWTLGWSSGPWPEHILFLDALLSIAVVITAWKIHAPRVAAALLPGAAWAHFALQARLIPAPQSTLAWGGLSIGVGFALLLVSLAASYWLRPRRRISS